MEHNNNNKNQPWLDRDSLALPAPLHNLPNHPKTLLQNYDPETSRSLEDHIKKFTLTIRLMNVRYEGVVFHIFPYTFEKSNSTWYFNLHVGSIANYTKFQNYFLDKFRKEITTGELMVELLIANSTLLL
jgi:hypothetical protein